MNVRISVVATTLLLGSCFGLERLEGVEPGTASGVAVDVDGAPVVAARVAVDGAPVGVRAASNGAFTVRGLEPATWALRLSDDDDADGIAERAGPGRLHARPGAGS